MAAIEVQGLTKAYGDPPVNDHLDFSIEGGEIFGYLGSNGAGKSTTLRRLMGFQAPTEGTATSFGHDVRSDRDLRQAKARIGCLPGDPTFTSAVIGAEFLDYRAALKGAEAAEPAGD